MRSKLCITLFLAVGVLFLLQPAARADQMQLYFTGTTSGGDSVPYLMRLSAPSDQHPDKGTLVWLNCDDHYDTIQTGEYWTATVFAGSANNLLQTSMSKKNTGWIETDADKAYDTKAYIELDESAYAGTAAYSNAIWHIFDNAIDCGGDVHTAGTCAWILKAATDAATADGGNYLTYRSSLTIYTGDYSNIHGGTGTAPQEFDGVPDGGMTLMLLGGALVGVATLRRKFRA